MEQKQNYLHPTKTFILLVVYYLVTLGYTISSGLYRLQGFLILSFALVVLSLVFFKPNLFSKKLETTEIFETLFNFALVISAALSLSYYAALYQEKNLFYSLSILLSLLTLILSTLYLFNLNPKLTNLPSFIFKTKFYFLLIFAVLLRFFVLLSSPHPQIDVFYILKLAPQKLLHGENPYQASYTSLFTDIPSDRFAYPPGAFLIVTPFSILFADPRITNVASEILTALLLWVILKRRFGHPPPSITEILPLLLLLAPRAPLVIEQAWLEPTFLFLLLLSYFLYSYQQRPHLTLTILGFLITLKQHLIFLPLFLWRSLNLSLKQLAVIGGTSLLVILPFFLWSPQAFIDDVVTGYFGAAERIQDLLNHSLSLGGFLHNQFQISYPSSLNILFSIPALLFVLIKQKRGWSQFFLSITLFYFAIFLLSTQAFLNFYYFIGQLALVNIVVALSEEA